ncbi:unnamed protein product [Polarella glacialis]|uniref:Uncharacterized protein n=1 Tax=Polarella glacialis TaxID=89957 RepID=A0A813JRV9_POLGL|nr:unnamed protein product [Polarella glacialis]
MSNIKMAQARLFHKQQLALSQAGLFRDDVREAIQAVTTVFRNEAIVCTLLVGVAGGTYRGRMVPPGIGIPTLVEQLYLLSLSTSIAYGVMGMLFALSGINMATECRKELLTTVMRLPIRDILREVEDAVVNESAETFESQELRQMFRAPLLDQMLKGRKSEQAVSDEVRPSDIAQSKMMQSEHDKVIVAVETQYNLVKNMFQEKERQWTALERVSGNFLFLSIAYTLNAFGGIAISEYYNHYDISYFVAHGFFIAIEAIIVYFANIRYKCSTHHNFFEMFLILAQAGCNLFPSWTAQLKTETHKKGNVFNERWCFNNRNINSTKQDKKITHSVRRRSSTWRFCFQTSSGGWQSSTNPSRCIVAVSVGIYWFVVVFVVVLFMLFFMLSPKCIQG